MGFSVLHLHLHGLFRGQHLELGRDADTGGQTTYVLELARALAARPEVERVEVVTRLINDRRISSDYAVPLEAVAPDLEIRRLPFGPRRYLRKELLWPHLDELADRLTEHLQRQPRLPDWIHAHYADAGYVGALLQRRLGIPLVFTGHSLGREKRRRLLAAGLEARHLDEHYSLARRIDAEELALAHSALVVTSTPQERDTQYARYCGFRGDVARVIPPGVDTRQFSPPPRGGAAESRIDALVTPFLRDPGLPPVLAICRADHRKNVPALLEAFGRSESLRQRHNLVLVLGCRDDCRQLERSQREVFQQVFELVDRFDLYGRVAYPKQHDRSQIPALYRWAAGLGGVFVNPALTEPFGLTLLEAAASGLPVIATDDGGPRDILASCGHGLLVDVSDLGALQRAIEGALADPVRWRRWQTDGIEAVSRHYSWDAHVLQYLGAITRHLPTGVGGGSTCSEPPASRRLVALDLDTALVAVDQAELTRLGQQLASDPDLALVVCTGRGFKAARLRFVELDLPDPLAWITRAGTEIHHRQTGAQRWNLDQAWSSRICRGWNRQALQAALAELEGPLQMQGSDDQSTFKLSYLLNETQPQLLEQVQHAVRCRGLQAHVQLVHHRYLDLLPPAASIAEALAFLARSSGGRLVAHHPGVVAVGVRHPVAQVVLPEHPAR